jgi:flagellar biosynthesis chaperone FliJ
MRVATQQADTQLHQLKSERSAYVGSQQTNRTRHQGLTDMRDVPNAASQFILYGPHTDFAYMRE